MTSHFETLSISSNFKSQPKNLHRLLLSFIMKRIMKRGHIEYVGNVEHAGIGHAEHAI